MPFNDSQSAAMAGRIGAHISWAQTKDRTARTHNARAAFEARFMRMVDEIDPDHELPAEQRQKMADSFRDAHYASMRRKSAIARRKRATS